MGAFDGNGNFVRSYSWAQDKANSIDITASRMDTEDNGFASGLSNCLTRDGQGKATADFAPATDLSYQLGTASLRWNAFNGKAISYIAPLLAYKTTTTSRSNTTTAANDPDLIIPIAATGVYIFELYVPVFGTTTSSQGIKWNINGVGTPTFAFSSATATSEWNNAQSASAAVASSVSAAAFLMTDMGATNLGAQVIRIRGGFTATAVSGAVLGFSWAQNSSSANATNVSAGAYFKVSQIA